MSDSLKRFVNHWTSAHNNYVCDREKDGEQLGRKEEKLNEKKQ